MAAVVCLPAGGEARRVTGFQAGPCNLLLDGLMRRLTGGREAYDAGGKHAVQGRCIEPLLERWLAHPALQRRPPRFLAPGEFGEEFVGQFATFGALGPGITRLISRFNIESTLEPANHNMQPIIVTSDKDAHILGVLVGVMRRC